MPNNLQYELNGTFEDALFHIALFGLYLNLLAYTLWFLIMCLYEFCVYVSVCMCESHFFLSLFYSGFIVSLLVSFLSNQRGEKTRGSA